MRYSNAGHEKPIVVTGRKMRYLDVIANLPIGIDEDKEFKSQESDICTDDMILLYTDGLTEAMNAGEELFGLKRIEQTITGELGSDESRGFPSFETSQQLLDTMSHSVASFVNGAEQSDDLTMLVIKFKKTQA